MTVFYGSFPLSITLKAPFLIAGTNPVEYGVDIAQIRNHHGQVVIPDSHVKGVLRHLWEYRKGDDSANDLFGKEGDDISNLGGRIWFTDLVADNAPGAKTLTRMAIDSQTGAAKRGSLFVIEQIARPGETVCFTGEVTLREKTKAEAQAIVDELKAALIFVSSIGKFKTAGFGRLVEYKVGDLSETPPPVAKTYANGQYDLEFQVNKSLLVDTTRPGGNMFFGSEIITGGTIKGALAAKLAAGGNDLTAADLSKTLSMMTITHAFPDAVEEPDVDEEPDYPLDYVQLKNKKQKKPLDADTVIDFSDEQKIPRYKPDFKHDNEKVKEPGPRKREYRTHVAIDWDTGGAEESKLFSTSSVLHEYKGQPVTWCATIGFPGKATAAQRDKFDLCMNELEHGLFTLGKTKARTVETRISETKTSPVQAGSATPKAGDWRLVLDTPLLMLREYHLSNEVLYWAAIKQYWRQATQNCYELKFEKGLPEIYAQQSFASGYQPLKFRFFGADRVEPFVLTKPGSVFILRCIDTAKAGVVRDKLERTGLPVAEWGLPKPLNRESDDPGKMELLTQPDFNACPFGPHNGYGHIRTEGAT